MTRPSPLPSPLAALLVAPLCAAACRCDAPPPAVAPPPAAGTPAAAPVAPPVRPLAEDEPSGCPTTPSAAFWRDLRGELDGPERAAAGGGPAGGPAARVRRAAALHRMAVLTGRIETLAQSLAEADAAVQIAPADVAARLLRAEVRGALADFAGALEDYDVALELSPRSRPARRGRAEILWALGRHAEAEPVLRAGALSADTAAQAGLAGLLFETGAVEESRQAYASAAARCRGPDPLTVARLDVRRGATYLDAGRWEQALRLFAAAAERVADFTPAEARLAQASALLGDHDRAETLYRKVAERSGDPAFLAAWAGVVEARGRPDEAAALRDRAGRAFDERLARWPAATWQAAAQFRLDVRGDAALALEPATRNAGLRQDPASWALLARVHARLGRTDEAVAGIGRALATPVRTATVFAAAAEVYAAAGRPADAQRMRVEALRLNPQAAR